MPEPAKIKKRPVLTRDYARAMKREPVEYYCEALEVTVYIKPLKLRRALEIVSVEGERSLMDNVETLLRLAAECIVEPDGTKVFDSVDEAEEKIGHRVLQLQDKMMEVQGLNTPDEKKK
jgi:hypothetical protein